MSSSNTDASSAADIPGGLTRATLDELLALAISAAHEAGDHLFAGQPSARMVQSKSSPTDIVTQRDRESEQLLTSRLLGARPTDSYLGEEGADVTGTGEVRWVVDPIDGTVNYLYGIPFWAVSVAAEVQGTAVVGVVHAPALGETFVATWGSGSRLVTSATEKVLRVRECADLQSALVATGFGYREERRRAQGAVIAEVLPRVRDIRRTGSCALDLCAVAMGRVDGFFERGTSDWDRSAGGLIAREAGARVEGLRGQPAGHDLAIATTPSIFAELHDLLADLRADEG